MTREGRCKTKDVSINQRNPLNRKTRLGTKRGSTLNIVSRKDRAKPIECPAMAVTGSGGRKQVSDIPAEISQLLVDTHLELAQAIQNFALFLLHLVIELVPFASAIGLEALHDRFQLKET